MLTCGVSLHGGQAAEVMINRHIQLY